MGASEVLHIQKGVEADMILAMLQGGTTSFGVVLTRELEVLAILNVGPKTFYPVLRGWRQKVSDPLFSRSVAPSPQCP